MIGGNSGRFRVCIQGPRLCAVLFALEILIDEAIILKFPFFGGYFFADAGEKHGPVI